MTMNKRILLASNSPRRRELLSGLGVDYQVRLLPDIDESFPPHLSAEEIPQYISRNKADAYAVEEDELLITADTIVYCKGEVLGKPVDEADACRMLRQLSGCTHQVVTGVTLKAREKVRTFSCTTQVTFAELSDEEIADMRYESMEDLAKKAFLAFAGFVVFGSGVVGAMLTLLGA